MNTLKKVFASFFLAIVTISLLIGIEGRKPNNLIYECRGGKPSRTYRCNRVEKNSALIIAFLIIINLLILDTIDLWKNK